MRISVRQFGQGEIRFMKEDVQSGLTTVVQRGGERVLLTNGKYQGDNTEEMAIQIRFAWTLCCLLGILIARS